MGLLSSNGLRRAGPSPLLAATPPGHDALMKRVLVFAAVFVGLGILARRVGQEMRNIDWEARFEAMPDNAPPKWMFRNIAAIRENTDRILELLERDRPGSAGPSADERAPDQPKPELVE